ncbi:MAG: hypothetical protein LAO56_25035 [Acidobacteriia bacterium]|nr:hypothetical protein [Terriglobia bacterium]
MPHSFAFCANEWVSSQSDCIQVTVNLDSYIYANGMTKGLHRYYGTHDLHFITCSCYHREPHLATPAATRMPVSS